MRKYSWFIGSRVPRRYSLNQPNDLRPMSERGSNTARQYLQTSATSGIGPIFATNPRNITVLALPSRHAKEGARSAVAHCLAQCNLTNRNTVVGESVGAPSPREKVSVAEGTPCTRGADKRNEGSGTHYTSQGRLTIPHFRVGVAFRSPARMESITESWVA